MARNWNMVDSLFPSARGQLRLHPKLLPRALCAKKDRGATGGNPSCGPLAARNRNRFQLYCHACSFLSQFPAATGRTTKGPWINGKESKTTTSATRIGLALEADRLLVLSTRPQVFACYAGWELLPVGRPRTGKIALTLPTPHRRPCAGGRYD